jgi:hypothetical protein
MTGDDLMSVVTRQDIPPNDVQNAEYDDIAVAS